MPAVVQWKPSHCKNKGKSSDTQDKLKEAEHEFVAAHKIQTALIQQEVNGEEFEIPMLLIHAQDHLMTSMTTKDLAIEIVELHEKIQRD